MGSCWDHVEINVGGFCDQIEIILGLNWGHFGITLGSFWNQFGIDLGSFRDYIRIILGACWDHFGVCLASLWDSFRSRKSQKSGNPKILGNPEFWDSQEPGILWGHFGINLGQILDQQRRRIFQRNTPHPTDRSRQDQPWSRFHPRRRHLLRF